jgi:DHA2 family multidrug resistance protein-like MFS transporter
MSVQTGARPARAGRREWIGLGALMLPCFVYAMDVTVLHLAVPALTRALRPSPAQLLWIVDVYGFLLAGGLITMGNLGDRIGRRRLLMMGAGAFALASAAAAFATSAAMLVAARAVLGVAAATLAPSTLSLIRNMFHDEAERTTAISIWATGFAAGGVAGPLVGGVLLAHFSWSAIFLVPVPVMGLLLVIGPRLLPEFRDPGARRLDLTSAALSLVSVLAVVYGTKRLAQDGLAAARVAAIALGAGVVLGGIFAARQRRLSDPLVDLRLFRVRVFSATIGAFLLNTMSIFAVMFYTAQYLQLVAGLAPFTAALWMLPSSICVVVSSLSSSRLTRVWPRTTVLVGGMLTCAVGFVVLAFVGSGGLPVVIAGSVLWSLGGGPVGTLATDLVVSHAPPERAGAVASLSETAAELGGALGLATLGSLGIAITRMGGSLSDAFRAVALAGAVLMLVAAAVLRAATAPGKSMAPVDPAGSGTSSP